jgi:hypothetical protein
LLNVRLIYEQIEAARSYLQNGSLVGCRLALILLDNAAELMMHRELEEQFAWEDKLAPKREPARTEWFQGEFGPKYTPDERKGAEREFEPKTRVLCIRLQRISTEDRHILNVCHKLCCEAFHRGILRQTILEHISRVLYLTVVELTVKLPFSGLTLPGATLTPEEADFLHRFGIVDATSLVTDDGRRRMADRLRDGVTFDSQSFLSALSDDLVDRIDETIRGLETVGDAMDRARIDRNLQYTQFWREIGASLVERGTREPELEAAYQRWQADSHARYTLRKMDLWRRQADAIRRAHTPALALDSYWGDRQEAPPA